MLETILIVVVIVCLIGWFATLPAANKFWRAAGRERSRKRFAKTFGPGAVVGIDPASPHAPDFGLFTGANFGKMQAAENFCRQHPAATVCFEDGRRMSGAEFAKMREAERGEGAVGK